MKIDKRILKEIIKFQINLDRLSNSKRTAVVNIFKKIYKNIRAGTEGNIIELSIKKREALIKEFGDVVGNGIAEIGTLLKDELLPAVAELQINATGKLFASLDIGLATGAIDVAANPFIQGNPLAEHFEKLTAATQFNMKAAVRTGVAVGETNTQIYNRVRDVLDVSRKSAMTLINTAVHTVGNNARHALYNANPNVVTALVWFTTLDAHVCQFCIARADLRWKNDEGNTPIGHDIAFQVPPIHPNDRCVLLPVIEPDLLPKIVEGERASSLGAVPGNTTFKDFLSMLDEDEVEDLLGVGRAKLYQEGKITLRDLIDNGRLITLDELKQRYN